MQRLPFLLSNRSTKYRIVLGTFQINLSQYQNVIVTIFTDNMSGDSQSLNAYATYHAPTPFGEYPGAKIVCISLDLSNVYNYEDVALENFQTFRSSGWYSDSDDSVDSYDLFHDNNKHADVMTYEEAHTLRGIGRRVLCELLKWACQMGIFDEYIVIGLSPNGKIDGKNEDDLPNKVYVPLGFQPVVRHTFNIPNDIFYMATIGQILNSYHNLCIQNS